jgi:hypothetical protein
MTLLDDEARALFTGPDEYTGCPHPQRADR